jgi:hypothetical protein
MKKNALITLSFLFVSVVVWSQTAHTNYGVNSGTLGDYSSFFGYNSGAASTSSSDYNSFFGTDSGLKLTTGMYNTFIGRSSGYNNISGAGNTFLGYYSGYANTGSGNVFIGKYAGYSEAGSNKLYIDNSSTTTPLIYGDFSTDMLRINGKIGIGWNHLNTTGSDDVNYEISLLPLNSKISFGDNRPVGYANGGVNCFVGEYGSSYDGTNTDTDILQVHGARGIYFTTLDKGLIAGARLTILENGNIGIGTTTPGQKLDVNGNLKVGANTLIVNTATGNVGIGTTNPGAKLDVNGKIRCEEIEVIADVPASDFVFETEYQLKPLSEVETFVKENKHLPEIPSAAQFKENGYKVGEMDDLLLRKIEELTLYIIAQDKRIQELEKNK